MRVRLGLMAATLALIGASTAAAQTRIVTGRVSDSLTSEVVTAGQVSVQGTTVGTTIKDDGTFTLAVPARDVVLAVRSIGFKRKDVSVPASQSSVTVALARDYFQLEAIVVTGQATGIERRNLANAVASVSAADMVKVPSQSIEHALTGKMAGADIQSNTNAPGGGVRVKLRGQTTLTGVYTPLYVVDGVIVSDASISGGVNIVTKASTTGGVIATASENNTNRIADLNPNDIENVEVLKGAAASAIYGSKASNGVILITTKRGRVGAPQFSVTQRFGVSAISRKMGLRRFTSVADAVEAKGANGSTYFQPGAFFDHEDELYGRKPLSYETSASISGGTETTRYFASGLVKRDGGIVQNTGYDKRSLRLNVDQDIGSRVKLSANAQVINSVANRGLFHNDNSGTSYGMVIPHTPSYYDLRATCPDGTRQAFCEGGIYPFNPFVASNPLQTAALLDYSETIWRSILGGSLSMELVRSTQHTLRLTGNGGVDFFNQRDYLYSPPELWFEDDDGLLGTVSLTDAQSMQANITGNMIYTFKPASGAFSATTSAGVQYEWRDLDIIRNVAQNLIGGLSNVNRGTVALLDQNRSYTEDQGFFAQEEFLTFGEKLLLTAGVRADRSTNNSDITKFHFFPKASASYRMNLVRGLVDDLKLRLAYGQTGNLPRFGQKYTELVGGNISGLNSVALPNSRGSTDMRPERQKEIEGGFDATMIGGRANLEVTLYQKNITDLLLTRQLPTYSGFSAEIFNGGAMRTRGIESSLTLVPVQSRSMQWTGRFNFALTRNVLTELPVAPYRTGGTLTGFHRFEAGLSPTQVWGSDSTFGSALVLIGDKESTFNLGYSNDLSFRAVRLYFLWDWKKGGLAGNGAQRHFDLSYNAESSCDTRVQPSNKCIGKERIDCFYAAKCTRELVQDNSYLKLRELTLSLDMPRSFVSNLWSGARYLRLSLSGRNLLMFTPWMGYDPEGVETGFNASPTRELGPYPPVRSAYFSIDFGF